jgi:predicted ArsR family transcriptional regulator
LQATRQEILDYLRRHGQATVKELAPHLGLTSTGIRQHLTVLERDGLVEAREERGHVGRPALVYRLTSTGDAVFPKQYGELALALIEESRSLLGTDSLQKLMKNVAGSFAAPYMTRVEGLPGSERAEETARILVERANVTESNWSDGEFLIKRYTCPFWSVAQRNSAVCALDVEFVRRLSASETKLTTSLLRGDSSCTFRLRPVNAPAAERR